MTPLKTFRNLSREKQHRIMEAAIEQFSAKGYAGTSINALVERLGIAKGSIFQYFGDKKGLFMFVCQSSLEMVKQNLRVVRDQTQGSDLFTRLKLTLHAGDRFLRKHPLIYRLYLKIMFESGIAFRDEILFSLRRHSMDYLHSLLRTARENGEIRSDLDLDRAAFVLDAIMDRFLQTQTIRHLDADHGLYQTTPENAAIWVDDLVDMIRRGIGT